MSNIKKEVFALKSYKKTKDKPTSEDFIQDGFLLFRSLEKAESFLEMCEHLNKKELSIKYEKHGYISTTISIYEKVQESSSFYVRTLEDYLYPLARKT